MNKHWRFKGGCRNFAERFRSGKIREWKKSNLGGDLASEMKMEEGPIVMTCKNPFPNKERVYAYDLVIK